VQLFKFVGFHLTVSNEVGHNRANQSHAGSEEPTVCPICTQHQLMGATIARKCERMCFKMHQHPTSHTDDHRQCTKNTKGDVPNKGKENAGNKAPNPQKLMLVHQLIMLMAEPRYVALHSEFDFHSSVVVNAEFSVDHSKEIVIDDN